MKRFETIDFRNFGTTGNFQQISSTAIKGLDIQSSIAQFRETKWRESLNLTSFHPFSPGQQKGNRFTDLVRYYNCHTKPRSMHRSST